MSACGTLAWPHVLPISFLFIETFNKLHYRFVYNRLAAGAKVPHIVEFCDIF